MDFKSNIKIIEGRIGYVFRDKSLLKQAFTRTSYNEAAYSDADTVVVLGADRYSQGRIERRYDMLSSKAFMAGANVVYVNQIGGSEELVYDGSSAVFNAQGKAVALLGSFVEELAFVDTARVDTEVEIPYQDKIANVRNALRLAISDYFTKKRLGKACLVLSGGIDSSDYYFLSIILKNHQKVNVFIDKFENL